MSRMFVNAAQSDLPGVAEDAGTVYASTMTTPHGTRGPQHPRPELAPARVRAIGEHAHHRIEERVPQPADEQHRAREPPR